MNRRQARALEKALIKTQMSRLSRRDQLLLLERQYGSHIRAICKHEASHVVVMQRLQHEYDAVRILPWACVDNEDYAVAARRDHPVESALISLVGPVSDSQVQKKHGWKTHPGSNGDDFMHAQVCALSILRPELKGPLFDGSHPNGLEVSLTKEDDIYMRLWLMAATYMAESLVEYFDPWIVKVADALYEESCLSKKRVIELCEGFPSIPDLRSVHTMEYQALQKGMEALMSRKSVFV